MKLNRKNKGKVIDVLLAINAIQAISMRVWRGAQKGSEPVQVEDIWLDNYAGSLDIVYLLMVGEKEKPAYESFECPAFAHHNSGKPIAWYRGRFSDNNKIFLDSPNKKFCSYIPDAINNVVMHSDLSAEEKYKLLVKMFSDLIRLSKKQKIKNG